MSRYVNIDKVLKCLRLNHKDVIYIDKNECAKRIKALPSIDIEPKRGEWRTTETLAVCSECGTLFEKSHLFGMHFANYCPYCGARMFAKDKWQTEREGE